MVINNGGGSIRKTAYVLIVICLGVSLSCGKGSSTPTTDYNTGKQINAAWTPTSLDCTGDYQSPGNIYASGTSSYVYIAPNAIPACARVKQVNPPVFTYVTGLPSGFSIDTATQGEVNATYKGTNTYLKGFTFALNGASGFMTGLADNIYLYIQFDQALAPAATPLNTFIRILNNDDNSLVDLHGTIENGSYVKANMYGLPNSFTVAVIYSPYMAAAPSVTSAKASWKAQSWCSIYNYKNKDVVAAVQVRSGISNPTPLDIYNTIRTWVSESAVDAQNQYISAGFSAPNLLVSNNSGEPCGTELGSNPRYNIVIDSSGPSFAYTSFGQVIRPQNNVYGRIFIPPQRIDDTAGNDLGSILAGVAQEMFYPIADAYGIISSATTKGIREGVAVTYGMTIDNDGKITVRNADPPNEIKMMSDFLNVNERANISPADTVSHANQDFFAFLAQGYGGDKYDYIVNMFEVISSWLSSAVLPTDRFQPPRSQLYDLMSSSFKNKLGNDLQSLFLNFVKQRLFEHDPASQFGRTGEITSGFAYNLMETSTEDVYNSLVQVTVDASTCALDAASVGGFADISPYAARAIEIIPVNTSASGVTITVNLIPDTGGFGGMWDGFNFVNNAVQSSHTQAVNTFSGFGKNTTDQIVVLPVNVSTDTVSYVDYNVKCQK